MNKSRLYKYFSIFLLIVILINCVPVVPVMAASGRTAEIYDLSNSVNVKRGKTTLKAYKKMRLKEGDTITTGKDSYAYIELDGDKVVKLDESTVVTISNLSGDTSTGKTNITLSSGQIYNDIKKKLKSNSTYQVRTSQTVMSVRGTIFVVKVSNRYQDAVDTTGNRLTPGAVSTSHNQQTIVKVFDGTVMLAPAGAPQNAVPVTANHISSVSDSSQNAAPVVSELEPEQYGAFELEEILNNPELLEYINELLLEAGTTFEEVLQQATQMEQQYQQQLDQLEAQLQQQEQASPAAISTSSSGNNSSQTINTGTLLGSISYDSGSLTPAFSSTHYDYTLGVTVPAITLSAVAVDPNATVELKYNEQSPIFATGQISYQCSNLDNQITPNVMQIKVTAQNGENKTYTIVISYITPCTDCLHPGTITFGDGSESNPYQVSTPAELNHIREHINNVNYGYIYIRQTADIIFTAADDFDPSSSGNFLPISGEMGTNFNGIYDGGGHTISGLKIINSNVGKVGLFSHISGQVKNLTIENSVIQEETSAYIGAIAGQSNGDITNCLMGNNTIVSGKANSTYHLNLGGIVGFNNGVVEDCANLGNVLYTAAVGDSETKVGGIAGRSEDTIENCYNNGTVSGQYSQADSTILGGIGGIVGAAGSDSIDGLEAKVRYCYNAGIVAATNVLGSGIGGIQGSINGTDIIIQNCYNVGVVTKVNNGVKSIGAGIYGDTINESNPDSPHIDVFGSYTLKGYGNDFTYMQLSSSEMIARMFELGFSGSSTDYIYPQINSNLHINKTGVSNLSNLVIGATVNCGSSNKNITVMDNSTNDVTEFGSDTYNYSHNLTSGKLEKLTVLPTANVAKSVSVEAFNKNTQVWQTVEASNGSYDLSAIPLDLTQPVKISVTVGTGDSQTVYRAAVFNQTANLKSLTSSNGMLLPTFEAEQTEYTLYVTSSAVTINALSIDPDAEIATTYSGNTENSTGSAICSISGMNPGDEGIVYINISTNGCSQEYIINVKYSDPPVACTHGFFAVGNGTEFNPYQVYCPEQFDHMREHPDAYYVQITDIDFTGKDFNGANPGNFDPIGTYTTPFSGSYNGVAYKISGLDIQSSGRFVGVFGYASEATFENIALENLSVLCSNNSQKSFVGGLVGFSSHYPYGSNCISGCSVGGYVSSGDLDNDIIIGGVVGYSPYGSKVFNCTNTAIVEVDDNSSTFNVYAGGVVGINGYYIDNCTNLGKLSINAPFSTVYAGGITGSNTTLNLPIADLSGNLGDTSSLSQQGTINLSRNTGEVSVISDNAARFGGIAGENNYKIEDSFNTGVISGTLLTNASSYIGGLIGFQKEEGNGFTPPTPSITGSYNSGNTSISALSLSTTLGGIAGYAEKGNIQNNYNVGHISYLNQAYEEVLGGGTIGDYSISSGFNGNNWLAGTGNPSTFGTQWEDLSFVYNMLVNGFKSNDMPYLYPQFYGNEHLSPPDAALLDSLVIDGINQADYLIPVVAPYDSGGSNSQEIIFAKETFNYSGVIQLKQITNINATPSSGVTVTDINIKTFDGTQWTQITPLNGIYTLSSYTALMIIITAEKDGAETKYRVYINT